MDGTSPNISDMLLNARISFRDVQLSDIFETAICKGTMNFPLHCEQCVASFFAKPSVGDTYRGDAAASKDTERKDKLKAIFFDALAKVIGKSVCHGERIGFLEVARGRSSAVFSCVHFCYLLDF